MDARKKAEGELFELLSLWIKEAKDNVYDPNDKLLMSKAINRIVRSINDLTFVDSPPNEDDDEDGYLHQYDDDE